MSNEELKSPTLDELEARAADLRREMFGLEMGDDFLFTNLNGNLPRYRSMEKELRETEAKIKLLSSTSD